MGGLLLHLWGAGRGQHGQTQLSKMACPFFAFYVATATCLARRDFQDSDKFRRDRFAGPAGSLVQGLVVSLSEALTEAGPTTLSPARQN